MHNRVRSCELTRSFVTCSVCCTSQYHLKNAGHPKRISNFSGDVKDSEAYTVLLHQISPGVCDNSALKISNPTDRATAVLANSKKLEVKAPIKARDIVSGNPRLNLIFTAAIFNQCPGYVAHPHASVHACTPSVSQLICPHRVRLCPVAVWTL
jgi:hypothetical protein